MQSILGCRGASRTNLAAAANATKVSHQEPHGTPHKRAAREPRASYSSVLLRSASLVVPFLGFRAIRPPTKHRTSSSSFKRSADIQQPICVVPFDHLWNLTVAPYRESARRL